MCNALTFHTFLYGSENLNLKKDKKTIDINRDEIFQKNSWDLLFGRNRNEEFLEEMKVETVDENIRRYKRNWLQHVKRMNNNRMPK